MLSSRSLFLRHLRRFQSTFAATAEAEPELTRTPPSSLPLSSSSPSPSPSQNSTFLPNKRREGEIYDADFGRKHLVSGISRYTEEVFERGAGCYVYSQDGRQFLDLTSGIGVLSTGHSHPHVVRHVQKQAEKLIHSQLSLGYHQPMLDLMGRLKRDYLPEPLHSFFFWNSGAEAVEAAIKIARMATKKKNIIAFQGAYHGRTFGTMSLTASKTMYNVSFGPFVPGVYHTPFPYYSQLPPGMSEEQMVDFCLSQFELLLHQQSAPGDTAACIVEPVLGEGGYVPAPVSFLTRLRKLCDKHGILMILDEVQTGYGRTGKMFAYEHYDILPDILILAKGIASGMPMSAVVSKNHLTENQPAGSMGGTYSANLLSCAAALATLDIFESEQLVANARARGEQFVSGLRQIAAMYPQLPIRDVRGKGLMVAVQFDGTVAKGTAGAIVQGLAGRGVLGLNCSAFEVLRFCPALTISSPQVDKALEIIADSLIAHFANK